MAPREEAALIRKTSKPIRVLDELEELDEWRSHYFSFVDRLSKVTFRAIALDYDGTLCDSSNRFIGPDNGLMRRLAQFIRSGTTIGIVTGRGQSVRDALRKTLPKAAWPKVLVGYYNGAVIQTLKDDASPSHKTSEQAFGDLREMLKQDVTLSHISDIDYRPFQISFQPKRPSFKRQVWDTLQHHITQAPGVRTVESSHSIDLIAAGVSKLNLVAALREKTKDARREAVLCIGDCGSWPGNDFELLAEPSSLSVSSVSADPESCWNIASPENRLIEATREYLDELLNASKSGLRLNRSRLKDDR